MDLAQGRASSAEPNLIINPRDFPRPAAAILSRASPKNKDSFRFRDCRILESYSNPTKERTTFPCPLPLPLLPSPAFHHYDIDPGSFHRQLLERQQGQDVGSRSIDQLLHIASLRRAQPYSKSFAFASPTRWQGSISLRYWQTSSLKMLCISRSRHQADRC